MAFIDQLPAVSFHDSEKALPQKGFKGFAQQNSDPELCQLTHKVTSHNAIEDKKSGVLDL